MIKVVHITTVHQVFDVRIFHKEASTLASSGFDVVLIACADREEILNGVRILPLRKPANRWERMTRTVWQAFRLALHEKADIYHFHDPELITAGLLLKVFGKRVIYDVHEDVAKDIYDKAYLPLWSKPVLRTAIKMYEWLALAAFDQIIAATSSIEQNFRSNKVTLVRNVPILGELTAPVDIPFVTRPENVVYVGGLAEFNGVEQMVLAMERLPEDSNIRLILGGKFSSSEQENAIRALPGWERVDYYGWVGREQIAGLFMQARAGLVVYQPTPNIMECEPNKFFEILSAGLPLIASNLPHWSKFIQQYECGTVVSPSDPCAIAVAIQSIVSQPDKAEEMGRRGQRTVIDDYNWGVDGSRLVDLYRDLVPYRAARSSRESVN